MPYIHINKETNEINLFGSIISLCEAKGIKPDNLYHNFSRNKLKEFENSEYRILKVKMERSKRGTNKNK